MDMLSSWGALPCRPFLRHFLNRTNHKWPAVPIDYVSIHFYANSNSRELPDTYTVGFFGGADAFIDQLRGHATLRDQMAPGVKIAISEIGVLYREEVTKLQRNRSEPPALFWLAAGGMYAYVVARLAEEGLAELVHHSQLVGYAPIRQWGLRGQQYPSTSLLDWLTGSGTAKYWVTRLLIDHLVAGLRTFRVSLEYAPPQGQLQVCGEVGGWTPDGSLSLGCDDPHATIAAIEFADFGRPRGVCGRYLPDRRCSMRPLAEMVARSRCVGRRHCTLRQSEFESLGARQGWREHTSRAAGVDHSAHMRGECWSGGSGDSFFELKVCCRLAADSPIHAPNSHQTSTRLASNPTPTPTHSLTRVYRMPCIATRMHMWWSEGIVREGRRGVAGLAAGKGRGGCARYPV